MIKIAWDPIYVHPLPEKHRFPMEKYELLPQQLMREGTFDEESFFSPSPIDKALVLKVHDANYVDKLETQNLSRQEELRSGFPISKQLVEREYIITGGTLQASHYALEHGIAFNIAGGTHHAYADCAEGFCLFNDIAVTSTVLLEEQLVKKILVVDLDVHQGNGTAKIFENDDRVFTFSMHAEHNYPLRKENSDLDIGLKDKTDGETYLSKLKSVLPQLIESEQPDFIFYQSGVDILESDKLGRLAVSANDCYLRDEMVLKMAFENQIPLVAVMGGGYSEDVMVIVEAHANTYRLAKNIYQ